MADRKKGTPVTNEQLLAKTEGLIHELRRRLLSGPEIKWEELKDVMWATEELYEHLCVALHLNPSGPYKVKITLGLVYDFKDLETLRRCVASGRVGGEGDLLSQDGGETWSPLSEFSGLVTDD
ncbi:hypothetical protein HY630_01200 [Candidatus Uhrbacteria bacterium]|nr:hypothetical protein [Candidatus Uhrbacteria bacterium]